MTPAVMQDVLIVVPDSRYTPAKGWTAVARAPLEGAVIASRVVERAGYRPRCVDLRGLPLDEEERRKRRLIEIARATQPSCLAVCIAGTPGSYRQVRQLADTLAGLSERIPVLVGGGLATISHGVLRRKVDSVDYWLVGECENSLGKFLDRLKGSRKEISVEGLNIVTKNKDKPDGVPFVSLDDDAIFKDLPYHYWLEGYDELQVGGRLEPKAPYPKVICYSTQRGCKHECKFCSNTSLWGGCKPRKRSLEKVKDDLDQLKNKSVEFVYLNDPTFNEEFDHSVGVARALGERRLPWACMIRALTAQAMGGPIDAIRDLFAVLGKNGCKTVFLGVESACESLVKEYKGAFEIDTVNKYIECAREHKVEVEAFFVTGLPNEHEPEVEASRAYVEEKRDDIVPRVKYFVPFPGSALFAESGLDEEETLESMSEMKFDGSDPIFPVPRWTRSDALVKLMKSFMNEANRNAAYSKNDELVAEARSEWLNQAEVGLLFPDADCASGIEERLRHFLSGALNGPGQDFLVDETHIGRIIVHGYKPDFLWSRSEAYRPVDFFFGEIHVACRECMQSSGVKGGSGELVPWLERHISPYWKRKFVDALGKPMQECFPKCWRNVHLDRPNIGNVCLCPDDHNRSQEFKHYTMREVLALSRMRLRKWALKKSEFMKTPSTSVDTSPVIMLFNRDSLKASNRGTSGALPNITVAAACSEEARDPRKKVDIEGYLNDHMGVFSVDDWEQASVWKEWRPYADDLPLPPDASDVELARKAWQRLGAPSPGHPERHSTTALKKLFSLDAECGTFLPTDEDVMQAVYNFEHQGSLLMVYFELNHKGWRTLLSTKGEVAGEGKKARVALLNEQLPAFCRDRMVPWHSVLREADDRWENHEAFGALYPGRSASALLGRPEPIHTKLAVLEDSLKSTHYTSFALKLRKAELFYQKRVLAEEDRPVDLALASMNDIWRSVYGEALEPHYPEFQRFQQLLNRMPDYRDHLTHSFQVYLAGSRMLDAILPEHETSTALTTESAISPRLEHRLNIILGCEGLKRFREIANEVYKANKSDEMTPCNWGEMEGAMTRYQWALASLMHDFACPAEKANEILGHLFGTFVGSKGADKKSGSDGLKVALSDRRQAYESLLHRLVARTRLGVGIDSEANYPSGNPILVEFTFEKLSEDHGFLSAVYLFNQLFDRDKTKGRKWWRLKSNAEDSVMRALFGRILRKNDATEEASKQPFVLRGEGKTDVELRSDDREMLARLAEGLILEVLDAIMKHNVFKKEYEVFAGQVSGPEYRFPNQYFSSNGGVFGGPLAGLLMLCDTVCDWGRIVHPDELRRHEKDGVRSDAGVPPEIERPECYVSDVRKEGERLVVEVQYQWRLPYSALQPKEGCIQDAYRRLCDSMHPYSPGFTPWGGCKDCYRQTKAADRAQKCDAWAMILRFWGANDQSLGLASKLRFTPESKTSKDAYSIPITVRLLSPWRDIKNVDLGSYTR